MSVGQENHSSFVGQEPKFVEYQRQLFKKLKRPLHIFDNIEKIVRSVIKPCNEVI